jgi:hypothetical protein
VLENGASNPDPALCGFWKCQHLNEYSALSKPPKALADGRMLVFEPPNRSESWVLELPVVGLCEKPCNFIHLKPRPPRGAPAFESPDAGTFFGNLADARHLDPSPAQIPLEPVGVL